MGPWIQGTEAFRQWAADGGTCRRAIVLVDVKEVLSQQKYWYDFRQLYTPVSSAAMGADGRAVERWSRWGVGARV